MQTFALEIRTTGKDDMDAPWKIAIGGYAGAGKTLFASTAPKPLYLFFNENPRFRSIVNRYMPHAKITNRTTADGQLQASVQDQLSLLITRLHLGQIPDVETIIIDTGDELFQGLKEARRLKNGGEFQIGDWAWLGDTFREIINAFIDLPYRTIVLFHLKTIQEDDKAVRGLALQGQALDEAPGWFDVVGVLDTYEVVDEHGDSVTKRTILTSSNRLYPWIKDHSGLLPHRFEISDNFVGDYDRFEGFLNGSVPSGESLLVDVVVSEDEEQVHDKVAIPTPEEVTAKKLENVAPKKSEEVQPKVETATLEVAADPQPETLEEVVGAEGAIFEEATPEALEEVSEPVALVEPEGLTDEEAKEIIEKELGPTTEVVQAESGTVCKCGTKVEDENLIDLSKLRFKGAVYCRPHFKEEIEKARS
jgi:hypothetical protein